MKIASIILLLTGLFVVAACSPSGDSEDPLAGDRPVTVTRNDQASSPAIDTNLPQTAVTEPPTPTAAPGPTEAIITPIEVTYVTPGQGEGPYYPLEKLDDRDNDLTVVDGATGAPAGEIVEFSGTVYDVTGKPVPGALIEIWQTDASGVYLHPGDPGTGQRDRNFQFYGEAITAADGGYRFRTIFPGHYEPRPRHIHVKVMYEGQELLTTQFYFEGDPELADEAMFTQAGGDGLHLLISLEEGQDADGKPIYIGTRDIILNVNLFS